MDEPIIEEVPGSNRGLVAALAEAGLPTDDLTQPGRTFFRFREHGQLIGFVGWERVDESAVLLRSLVVVPAERGRGAGEALARWALTRLAELGFTEAWLLTTTIDLLALRLGFDRRDRADAPDAIRQSRQFAGLCPSSAALFHRSIP